MKLSSRRLQFSEKSVTKKLRWLSLSLSFFSHFVVNLAVQRSVRGHDRAASRTTRFDSSRANYGRGSICIMQWQTRSVMREISIIIALSRRFRGLRLKAQGSSWSRKSNDRAIAVSMFVPILSPFANSAARNCNYFDSWPATGGWMTTRPVDHCPVLPAHAQWMTAILYCCACGGRRKLKSIKLRCTKQAEESNQEWIMSCSSFLRPTAAWLLAFTSSSSTLLLWLSSSCAPCSFIVYLCLLVSRTLLASEHACTRRLDSGFGRLQRPVACAVV